jgi:hypothetical protein
MIGYVLDEEDRLLISIKSYTAKWKNALRQPHVAVVVPDGPAKSARVAAAMRPAPALPMSVPCSRAGARFSVQFSMHQSFVPTGSLESHWKPEAGDCSVLSVDCVQGTTSAGLLGASTP